LYREDSVMVAPEFVLKTTPPRIPRSAMERAPLDAAGDERFENATVAVVAPAGFGKTTLLAQWRRRRMEQGAMVAWLRVDAQDEPGRFAIGLLHALHAASGHAPFEAILAQLADDSRHDIEALTNLLAEIAYLGKPSILVIDDAERLPRHTAARSLRYLLDNAPPNLQTVIGSRNALPFDAWELLAKGGLVLGPDQMRFTLAESTTLLRHRLGDRLLPDDCARLHEALCGWPLGLQLLSATLEGEADLTAAIRSLSGRRGDVERFFFDTLVARLAPHLTEFLVRTAILEDLNPDVCEAVTAQPNAREFLSRLESDTPIIVGGVDDWVRVHPLARDFLLGRFEQLPHEEQHTLHVRAARWFAARERFHDAASHALASGDAHLAHVYAARALSTLATQGKLLEARDWLDRIPPEMLAADEDLRLVAAWVMGVGDRHAEAVQTAQEILAKPDIPAQRRFAALRVAGTGAMFGDRVGLVPDLVDQWRETLTTAGRIEDPILGIAYTNGMAIVALHSGDTAEVRRLLARNPTGSALPIAYSMLLKALSHLWDGDALHVETTIGPALAAAERRTGRRGVVASVFAAVLAAACLEQDRVSEAEALLAHRLDIIERFGLPEALLLAYRTLAYIALAHGDERRALLLLENLAAVSLARHIPRLAMHAIAERIRIHALQGRHDTVQHLLRELDDFAPVFAEAAFSIYRPRFELVAAIAHAHAALAREDFDEANARLDHAERCALRLRRRRDALTVKVLRAVVAQQQARPEAAALLDEACGLANMVGCGRLLEDTHPLAVAMRAASGDAVPASSAAHARARKPEPLAVARGALLTAKEAEILELLGKGLSNKSIALTLGIGYETAKWHVRNVTQKLGASTREHAVDRARMLGLLTQ
jgi:LuxR family maltose regulon positive regulatory protein